MFVITVLPASLRVRLMYNGHRVTEIDEARLKDWVEQHYPRPWPQRIELTEQAVYDMCYYLERGPN